MGLQVFRVRFWKMNPERVASLHDSGIFSILPLLAIPVWVKECLTLGTGRNTKVYEPYTRASSRRR